MSSYGIALLLGVIFCCVEKVLAVDLSISPVRGSRGQSILIKVDPAMQYFDGTVCGTWRTSQNRCVRHRFRGTWFLDGELYPNSLYSLNIRSKDEEIVAPFRTDYGVPFTPIKVVSLIAKETSIFLSWTPEFPEHLHGPPTGYRLLVCQLTESVTCKVKHNLDNHTTLDDLHPMTRYSIAVWAFNVDSFGDVLEEPRIAAPIVVQTDSMALPVMVPAVLASLSLACLVVLSLLALKVHFFPSGNKHMLLVEKDFPI